jgi:TrmH family RNA methyltransferase
MSPIDSPRNAHVAAARALLSRKGRVAASAFLVEGPHAVSEALTAPRHRLRELFATESAMAREPELLRDASAQGVMIRPVTERVLAGFRDTVTPQGLIAVVEIPTVELSDALGAAPRLVAVLEAVADPGNAGTAIRTADAAGADAVVLTPRSVDVWAGKSVRASAGSVFHLPVVTDCPLEAAAATAAEHGCQVLATAADGEHDLDDLIDAGVLAQPTAWVFGNEAHGLTSAAREIADRIVRVPSYGAAESLNLAAAVAVCLFASARAQRRR